MKEVDETVVVETLPIFYGAGVRACGSKRYNELTVRN